MSIKAVIFDMDGVLIDSEPVWKQSGVDVFNSFGIPATWDDLMALTGTPALGIVKAIYAKYNAEPMPVEEMAAHLNEYAIASILAKKPLIEGVKETLQKLADLGYKMAVASASPRKLLEEITKSCNIEAYFSYLSSATELSYNKPHPEVYLHAAKMLNVAPAECVGIEDSIVGMTAVKAASMKCIVIPGILDNKDPRWSLADVKLNALLEIDQALLQRLAQK
ncbi:sugar-phosphatase [Mesocricetibacter intestinalis]|uniref:Sugar-phosphatase n=1 Tax=Mesocricetibacter intestinalis TaxID=1521930 RepID=A0A4V3D9X1_9PAST|nr:hexitol phosphatase HxpB [Mesocricetibacter intestinalis]TDQ59072.1 sugar-phosphatase [Mesocricetibacter intestinalis]